jgi:predicted kinase
MCGLAFAGKSTVARALAASLGAAIVSLDEITRERGLAHGGSGLPAEAWAESHRLATARVAALMAGGGDLVVDDTACFRFLRDDWRRLAAAHGYEAALVLVDTPAAEIQARRRANVTAGNREPIDDGVFAAHLASFEWPGADEPVVVLRSPDDLKAWVAGLSGSAAPQYD